MTEVGQEFHAERMDRTEEGAIECNLHFRAQIFVEQSLSRALLHFVCRAIRESDDNEARQDFRGSSRTRDRQNALRDCSRLARTGRCDHKKLRSGSLAKRARAASSRGITMFPTPLFRARARDALAPIYLPRCRYRLAR